MERLVGMNTDKEVERLKEEVRDRNDLINMLQSKNDDLREEKIILMSTAGYKKSISKDGDLLSL